MRRALWLFISLGACRPAEAPTSPEEPETSSAGASRWQPAGPDVAPPPPDEPLGEPGRLAGITAAHNQVRARVGVGPLRWDPALADYAAQWAAELRRRDCSLDHRPRQGPFAQRYGENLFWQAGGQVDADDVVREWASEEADYDVKRNRCRGVCGHYTQVVWKQTQRLGCAMASCGAAEVWVCNYDPPGNFNGQRPY